MKDLLLKGAKELGVPLDEQQAEQFCRYAKLLVEWNEKINLTAITDDNGIVTKHFLDSLTPILTDKVRGAVIDVGTGAGFPGLPLKIAKPEIKLTLLDSLNKRVKFLQTVTDELGLDNVECIHSRAEDGGRNKDLREKFDLCVSRAVANLAVLCEFCLPFVKVGGIFMALKGPLADEEIENAKRSIKELGGEVCDTAEFDIPFTDLNHKIVMIKKVRHTPKQYPRKAGVPTKNPLV